MIQEAKSFLTLNYVILFCIRYNFSVIDVFTKRSISKELTLWAH